MCVLALWEKILRRISGDVRNSYTHIRSAALAWWGTWLRMERYSAQKTNGNHRFRVTSEPEGPQRSNALGGSVAPHRGICCEKGRMLAQLVEFLTLKTLKLPLLLLSPSPHWSARKAWTALGQWTLQQTHLRETRLQGRFRREGRKGWSWTTPNSWDVTRKCKFGVMNSEQGHVKLWTFIKQRRKTVYQHCGWAYEIQEWVCVGACACERVKKKKKA